MGVHRKEIPPILIISPRIDPKVAGNVWHRLFRGPEPRPHPTRRELGAVDNGRGVGPRL